MSSPLGFNLLDFNLNFFRIVSRLQLNFICKLLHLYWPGHQQQLWDFHLFILWNILKCTLCIDENDNSVNVLLTKYLKINASAPLYFFMARQQQANVLKLDSVQCKTQTGYKICPTVSPSLLNSVLNSQLQHYFSFLGATNDHTWNWVQC